MNKPKALIADDDLGTRISLKNILEQLGFIIEQAEDGQQASEMLRRDSYQFAFLDCNMPEKTGVELIKEITKEKSKCVIVIVTGYECLDKNFAETMGAHEFIKKPFSFEEIKRVVERY